MVSSIVPGATGAAAALGAEPRLSRNAAPTQREDVTKLGDRVELSSAGSWAAARESVRNGLDQVHQALAIGHEAQSMLLRVQAIARGEGGGQAELKQTLEAFAKRVDVAAASAGLVVGKDLLVQAEPSSTPVHITGVDMRIKAEAEAGDVMKLTLTASVDDPSALMTAVQRSLDALQTAMEHLFDAARALEAHQGFLGAAEGVGRAANVDFDADGARLLALQVRQGLEAAGSAPIANADPQAVLSLFRA